MPTAGYLSLIGLWTALIGAALVIMLLVTNPAEIGPGGVTMWFIGLLGVFWGALSLMLYGAKSLLHLHATGAKRLRYSARQGLLVGGWLTVVVGLSSLRQLNLRDVLLLAFILAVVELYIRLRQA